MFKNIFCFDRTPLDHCFLYLSVNFDKFFRTLLLQSTSEKLLFHVEVAEFRPPDTIKNYFVQEREEAIWRRSFSQNPTNLQVYKKKTLSHILLHVFFFHFLRMYQDSLFRKSFESVWHNFFQEMKAESSLTCNVLVQLRFI